MYIYFIVIVFIIICVTGITCINRHKGYDYEDLKFGLTMLLVICIIAIISMGIGTIIMKSNSTGELEKYNARREVLIYQIENKTYMNDNNLGANELFTQVGEYNGEISRGRAGLHNNWTNWFFNSCYDDCTLIDLNNIDGEQD